MIVNQVNPEKPVLINFQGDVDDFTTNELSVILSHLASTKAQEVKLVLSTPGGSVSKGMYLHNLIKGLPFDVTTHNVGTVDSIGNVIYLAGTKRLATPNSRFMLHGVSRTWRADGDGMVSLNERALRDALKYVERDQQVIVDTIASHTLLTREMVCEAFKDGDTILTPEDAQEKGVVHTIEELSIPQGTQVLSVYSKA